ncbi:hypothetical protein N0V93_000929 [Gnomoniopsis smithogilvyi]|uniref:Beta-xylanase n=1 Tax=Gnomoniopsis smithogilvyi TaxID=1191159 RepID=A0A9W9D175_9PEZI|nr:hypothetical protein N0V93_000929 [Gnomoniopsis smithogilvyi]
MFVRSLHGYGLLSASLVAAALGGHGGKTVTVVKTVTASADAECPTSSSSVASPTSLNTAYTNSSATTTASTLTSENPTGTTLIATATATSSGLNDAAKAIGKLWFGTAADIPQTGEITDPYYLAQFNNTHDFGEATPANIMKFLYTEPEQNVFNYTGGEYFLDLAEASGKLVRCHNLIWYNQLPDWVTAPAVNWTNETLSAVLVNHVTNLVEHFGDRCYSWDVVNEALSDSPAGALADNIWLEVIGSEYFFMAFDAATKAVQKNNLNVKLYYNDYNIEYAGNKSTAAQSLVSQLKARGIQIDGIGLESHFIAGQTPSQADQEANMNAFTALDVDVVITELDVRLPALPPNATSQAQQVLDYYNSVAACANVERCVGVTVWDFDDTYSWIPSTFAGQGYADLFFQPDGANTPLVKKAAYDGCLEALTGAAEAP